MTTDSFASAQERIVARQAELRLQAENARLEQQASINASSLARLPFPLNQSANLLSSVSSTLLHRGGTSPAFRVGQVDAELLDEELLSLLNEQICQALKYLGNQLQDDWSREISLGLRAILFKLSFWDHNASYGAFLQNLRYTDARNPAPNLPVPTKIQKALYGLITVLGRYGWEKWEDWLIEQEGGYDTPSGMVQSLSRLTNRLSAVHSTAAFVSFVVFLVNGRYRTLTDRILRLRLISPINQIAREVSFEYLNRQLVWHAFTEFLLFILPLVGIGRWRRWLTRAWRRTKTALQSEAMEDEVETKNGPLNFLPERTCAICYQDQNPNSTSEAEILGANTGAGGGIVGSAATDIVNPYETIPCGCVYCFVCLTSKIEAEEGSGWSCLRCGELVYKCKPWSGDILIERKQRNGGKSVGFVTDSADRDHQVSVETNEISSELGGSQWALEGDDASVTER